MPGIIPKEICVPIFMACSSVSKSSATSEEKKVENSTKYKEMNCDEIQFTSFNYDDKTTVALSRCSLLSVGNDLEDTEVYNVTEDIAYSGIPVPKGHKSTRISKETPCTILTADTLGAVRSRRILKVFFDTSSKKTLIHREVLHRGIQTKKLSDAQKLKTLAGNFDTSEMVKLRDTRLPEFDKKQAHR